MTEQIFQVDAISRESRLAVLDTGEVIDLTAFLDADGDEIDDPTDAVFAIACIPGIGFLCVDLRNYGGPKH